MSEVDFGPYAETPEAAVDFYCAALQKVLAETEGPAAIMWLCAPQLWPRWFDLLGGKKVGFWTVTSSFTVLPMVRRLTAEPVDAA